MKVLTSMVLVIFALISHGQLLEVKPDRTAIVKNGPLGNSPQIAALSSGTRVTKIGEVPRYFSIQLSDGRTGFSYKGNFIEVAGTTNAPVLVTAETLLARTDVLKIIVLDVEKGDSTLIVCPQENGNRDIILIDTGEKNDGDRIKKELLKHGLSPSGKPVNRLFVSHYDSDHIGPIAEIAPLCETIYDHGPNNEDGFYRTAMNGADRRTITLSYQETFSGGVNIDCVAVNRMTRNNLTATASSDDNDNSVALQVSFRGFDYFTAGDLTFTVEDSLIGAVRNCDVYHVNHHGSETTSSGLNFLLALDPEVSVVSNGTDYGHPRANVANRLISQVGSRFYQTNINPKDKAHHPDPKFIADDTFHSKIKDENDEGATGNITIVIDPVSRLYYVIMPGLPLPEATYQVEMP